MKALLSALCKEPSVAKIKAAFARQSGSTFVYGFSGSAKYLIFAACYRAEPKTVLVVADDNEHLKKWQDDLSSFLPYGEITELPETAIAIDNVTAKSGDLIARRMETLGRMLQNVPGIILTTASAIAQKDISVEDYRQLSLKLKPGTEIGREKLVARLVELGYENTVEVERIGEFSVRGGIVDIYPVNTAAPVRIEFFDETVESLRNFAVATKRSQQNISEVMILPISSAGHTPSASVLEFLQSGATVILDEPARIKETVEKRRWEDADAAADYFAWTQIQSLLKEKNTIYCSLLPKKIPGVEPDQLISMSIRQTAPYRQQFELLVEDAANWSKNNSRVVMFTGNSDKAASLRELLARYRVPAVHNDDPTEIKPGQIIISGGTIAEGFQFNDISFVILSPHDIYGNRKKRHLRQFQSDNTGDKIKHFTEIRIGDYVVHVNHGIGKYIGVETIDMGGVKRDYLHIQYGGRDKLFVPTDQVELLHKYIGAEGHVPKLSRIGSQEWLKAKARAKSSVEDIAEGLLKLYAERQVAGGIEFLPDTAWQKDFEDAFPFEETPDQLRAIEEIKSDMEHPKPMERLLCGDVGFGKTEVAIRAAFKAVMSGYQVAVLVPTTVLAQQHYQTFSDRFASFGPVVDVVCRFRTVKEQKATLSRVEAGLIDVLIGTHALLNRKRVNFKKLGLLVVDEEQRFGVKQKEKIKELSKGIDVLTLSATPIPRTLHMSLAGARDMSIIETPPAERYPIQTYVAEESDALIASAIRREIKRGGQIFFVYNRVATIDKMRRRLIELVPEARIEIGHGQMSEERLENVMMDFFEGNFDVLLASSIIENGLDIANANTIIVYDADRFGLSQLYQMRGRVGRSTHLAYAYFLYRRDKILTEQAEKRLLALKEFAELGAGFRIAMRDLELRGAGNILGAEQHGHIYGVGFEMYCQMLEEAVARLKTGKAVAPPLEPRLELKVEAYIDGGYISDAMHKIEIYQRIAACRDDARIEYLLDEMRDRFGEPTKPVMTLLMVARLKNVARKLGIKYIIQKDAVLEITFIKDPPVDRDNIVNIMQSYPQKVRFIPAENQLRFVIKDSERADILSILANILKQLGGDNLAELNTKAGKRKTAPANNS